MKKLILMAFLGTTILLNTNVSAQININISVQPLWGPIGYDKVENYYLPDIETYYSVPTKQFTYLNNGKWVTTTTLPSRYSNYNLYNGYKVVVNGDRPYLNYKKDKVKYVKYKNWGGKQLIIKNSNDKKYYIVKGHPRGMPPGQAKKMIIGKGKSGKESKGNGKSHGNGKH